jgi:hypothetical protein
MAGMNRTFSFSLIAALLAVISFRCTEDETMRETEDAPRDSVSQATAGTGAISCSSCTYIIPPGATLVDGKTLGIRPGDVICFSSSGKYTNSITFKNIIGTAEKPVIISNCGGNVVLTVSSKPFNVKTSNSRFFRLTGGNVDDVYGIRMSGSTSNGLVLAELSTNFEIDHVEIADVGFAGIMAKTDPTCDDATNRGYFTMRNISIHHNYVHHTGGEGLYIGHSFYGGYTLSCGVKLPHTIEGSRIYKNKVTHTGWDGIQVGCATKDANIFQNTVENFGTKQKADQNYGILLGSGTAGRCYSNFIRGGTGTSLTVFGHGDNIIYNNIIVNSARTGIFCDERTTTFGAGYSVINNTIINPKEVGIRMYSEKVPKNVVTNNIIVNPGAFDTYGSSAYIMKLNSMTNVEMSNNYTTRNIGDVKFVNAGAFNYRLTSGSPAINKGKSVSMYNIPQDFYGASRLKGGYYDIGASEY